MAEVWLQANRRVFLVPLLVLGVVAAGCVLAAILTGLESIAGIAAAVFAVAAVVACLGLAWLARRPRLSFDVGRLWFYVRFGPPVGVPVENVEAFLLGRGPTFLGSERDTTETSTLVVRIAERAAEFERVETAALLAAWCGHYVTLRGTWTEPLGLDLVNRLNLKLYDTQRQLSGTPKSAAANHSSVAEPAK